MMIFDIAAALYSAALNVPPYVVPFGIAVGHFLEWFGHRVEHWLTGVKRALARAALRLAQFAVSCGVMVLIACYTIYGAQVYAKYIASNDGQQHAAY